MVSESVSPPNWLELPPEVTAAILSRLDDFDILRSVQFVCSLWRAISRDPLRWRTIDIRVPDRSERRSHLVPMCLSAVDYSSGHLESIAVDGFGSDHLLLYLAQRPNQIKRLKLRNCNDITDNGFYSAVSMLPLLEELELESTSFSVECIEVMGRFCPRLQSLTLRRWKKGNICRSKFRDSDLNNDAIAIASNLPGLRRLDIAFNHLTETGVEAILQGCPVLETLDLCSCFNVIMGDGLHRLCKEKLKHFWPPKVHSSSHCDDRKSNVKRDNDEDRSCDDRRNGGYYGDGDEYEYSESDDDILDVSDDEIYDDSDSEFCESEVGNESSGFEDSDDDYGDLSDNNNPDDDFSYSSDEEI